MKNRHSVFPAFFLAAFLLISINGETPTANNLEQTQSSIFVSSIGGRIMSCDVPVNGVTVTVSHDSGASATTTTTNGFYRFFNLASQVRRRHPITFSRRRTGLLRILTAM